MKIKTESAKKTKATKYGKKAQFVLLMDILLLAVLTFAFLGLSLKYNKFCPGGKCTVGEEQMKLFGHFAEAEKAKLYLDKSADYAMERAIAYAINIAGSDGKCGIITTVPVYFDGDRNCVPNSKEIKKTLEDSFADELSQYSSAYPMDKYLVQFPENYNLDVGQVIIAKSIDDLKIAEKGEEIIYDSVTPAEIEKILDTARSKIGKVRYKYGGNSEDNMDCSRFVQWSFEKEDIKLPRTSIEQAKLGLKNNEIKVSDKIGPDAKLELNNLKPGDILFFKGKLPHEKAGLDIGHVGIYLGDNKFIHSAGSRVPGGVIESTLSNRKDYRGAIRVVKDDKSSDSENYLSLYEPGISLKSERTLTTTGFIDYKNATYDPVRGTEEDLGIFEKRAMEKYGGFIDEASKTHKVDKALILTVMFRENQGLNPDSGDKKGYGLMQVSYGITTSPCCRNKCGTTGDAQTELSDPKKNICCGSCYLASLIERYDSNLELVFIGYNAGPATANILKAKLSDIKNEAEFDDMLKKTIIGVYKEKGSRKYEITSSYIIQGLKYYDFFAGEVNEMEGDALISDDAKILYNDKIKMAVFNSFDIESEIKEAGKTAAESKKKFVDCLQKGSGIEDDNDIETCSRLVGAEKVEVEHENNFIEELDDSFQTTTIILNLKKQINYVGSLTGAKADSIKFAVIVYDNIPPPETQIFNVIRRENTITKENEIIISWDINKASDTSQYTVSCSLSKTSEKETEIKTLESYERMTSTKINDLKCSDKTVKDGEKYNFYVRATDNNGNKQENAKPFSFTIPKKLCCRKTSMPITEYKLRYEKCEAGEEPVGLENC